MMGLKASDANGDIFFQDNGISTALRRKFLGGIECNMIVIASESFGQITCDRHTVSRTISKYYLQNCCVIANRYHSR